MTRLLAIALVAASFMLPVLAQNSTAPNPAGLPAQVTFSEHIASIVFEKCASCHRPGEIGPFPLLSYADVRKHGKLIQQVTQDRTMPPWHPAPGHGSFRDELRLTDQQLALIQRWIETGMSEGDPSKLPKLPQFPEGWQLGKPDLVVSMDKPFQVPATGRDIYRSFRLPVNLPEDKWITAIELRPSARSVVHHVLFFAGKSGSGGAGQGNLPGFAAGLGRAGGTMLGGWAAGARPAHLPMDLALHLPKGSDLILQTHFHPSGKVEQEKTTVGLYFAKKQPERSLLVFQAPPFFGVTAGINIPAGAKDYRIKGKFKAPVDIELVSVSGHAHYICETMKATATLPDGSKQSLLYIPRWDFNWQGNYIYKEPVKLPKETQIDVEITYNNSADNPANPFNPPRRITWGPASTDEMGSITFGCVAARESDVPVLKRSIRTQMIDLGGIGGFLKK
jgi:hypothetical protein